jgi:hypothetical protein
MNAFFTGFQLTAIRLKRNSWRMQKQVRLGEEYVTSPQKLTQKNSVCNQTEFQFSAN